MLDGHVIRVFCKVKNLKEAIERAWYEADAKQYPHG